MQSCGALAVVVVRQVQKLERHLTFVYAELKGEGGPRQAAAVSAQGAHKLQRKMTY